MASFETDKIIDVIRGLDPARSASPSPDRRQAIRDEALRRGSTGNARRGIRPRSKLRIAGLAALGATAILALSLIGRSGDENQAGPQFAKAAVRVAEANPRYLVTAPGWSVTDAYAFGEDGGEMRFSDGEGSLGLVWYPARLYERYREDRASQIPEDPIEVAGLEGITVGYGGTDYATMLPPQGEVFVEIRGDLGSEEAYRRVVSTLEPTDVADWLSAMPPKVVQPQEQVDIVDDLLKGVPLPPSFDLEGIRSDLALDRETLDLKIASDVACGWLDSWAAADAEGDADAKQRAVNAMATSSEWPVLSRLAGAKQGLIQDLSDDIAAGRLDRSFGGAILTTDEGRSFAYGPAYALQLQCDSQSRREIRSGSPDGG